MEEEWGVERQEVKLVMLMTIAKRAKAEQANDRARVGNVNRQERRDKWVGRSWEGGVREVATLNKRQTAKSEKRNFYVNEHHFSLFAFTSA